MPDWSIVRPKHAEYQTFPRPESKSAQWESNPHIRHGKAVGCRYIMGAWLEARLSKIIRAPGGTRTLVAADQPTVGARGAVSLPLDDQCLSVRLVGIEPTSSGLRDRCITLSATVPNQSARWELNPRPASYKDAALTVELRASESRAGGSRTHTVRIKSPPCCQLHHDPRRRSGVCVCNGLAT